MSVAQNMNWIWATIDNKTTTMFQPETGTPKRISSIRTKFGSDLEIRFKDGSLITVTPSNVASIRESLF